MENFTLPIKTQTNGRKLGFTEQKLERTVENSKLPIKTQTNGRKLKFTNKSLSKRWKTPNYQFKSKRIGRKLEFTEQKLERTVENGCTSTQPHRNYRNSKNSRCGWGQVLHGPTVGA